MKKYIITCAALFAMSYYGHAQIGIGTKTPDATTALDMSQVKNKGVLFPQITLADIKSVAPFTTSLKKGLLVYNTNTTVVGIKGDATGFYQWNGLIWDKLVSHDEVVKLIEDNKGVSNEDLQKIVKEIVNEYKDGKFSGTSVVMYDFDKEEFYTLVKDKDGNVVKSTPINLTNAIRKAETNTFIRPVQDENKKTVGYLYFSEEAIKSWQKNNPAIAADYFKQMKKEDGVFMDVLGDVTNNLEEIIKSKKEFFETFIKNIKGNVTVSVEGDRTYLVYNDGTKEIKIDLSQLETETFIRTIKESKEGKEVIMGYVHFSEEQINKWIKANPAGANSYKTEMKNSDGTYLDIVGAISNNFKEIVNNNGDVITQIIQNTKGNVTVKVTDGKTYLVYKDESGKEVVIDLSAMEVDTFIRAIIDPKTDKIVNYVYFSEAAITKWQSANKDIASRYKDMMKETDGGTIIDIVGTVNQNFEKIINNEGNKEFITKIITNSEGNVTVKVVDGRTVLVYKDKEGKEQIIDLSSLEVDTFVKAIVDPKTDKILNYVYFGEAAITAWQKANPKKAEDYKDLMKPTDGGVIIDVVGAVSQNFQEIINQGDNIKYVTEVINKTGGNVSVKIDANGKTVLVYLDKDGKEQVVDLSAIETETYIKEVLDAAGKKVTGYVYFSEEAINKWRKANPNKDYKTQMLPADGKLIDVFGTVSNNFQEILNEGDNIKNITEVINKTGGNVSVKVDANGKTVLVYFDKDGKEQVVDLSGNETLTFIRDVKKTVKVDGKDIEKVVGYVYFSEEAISKWIKDNTGKLDTKLYKDLMKDSDGKLIDVIGTVSQNFQEIINEGDNIKNITEVINKTGGNVSVKVDANGKTVLVYFDKDGKEQVVDLSGNETLTFIRDVKKTVKVDGKDVEKVAGYVYFSEEAISKWIKDNTGKLDTKLYKDLMKDSDGKLIDVIGTVSQNFQEIINEGDNIKNITEVINKTGGNVSVKVDANGKTVLVYFDKDGKEQVVDLSGNETLTFIRDVKKTVKVDGKDVEKVAGYVYFSEEAISKWIKDNTGKLDTKLYKDLMKDSDGKLIDVIGTVSQNFQEIINEGDNIKNITEVINKTGGNVTVKVDENGKTVLIYFDKNGKEQVVDLSNNETETYIKEVVDAKTGKVTGYVYFGEEAISKWRKANPGKDYKNDMVSADGKLLDVVGDVSNNFKEIVEKNETIINNVKGNVSVKVEGEKTYLVYKDDAGVEQKVDLSANETDTFVRIVPGKDSKGNAINLKYVYFGESVIATWKKDPVNKGKDYKIDMPDSLGTTIDVLNDVTNNLGDIINKSGDTFNNILNEYLTKGGNVYYGKLEGGTTDVLYSMIKDANGKETRTVIDLTNTIKEILKEENNELIKELKSSVSYNIGKDVTETNIKFDGKVVNTFSSKVTVVVNDAEVKGVEAPDSLGRNDINVFDIKLYTPNGKLVTVGITDIKYDSRSGLLDFTLGNGDIYTPITGGEYKVVVYFTK